MTVTRLGHLQRALAREGIDARLLGITYDPAYDTPNRLKAYATSRGFETNERSHVFRVIGGMKAEQSARTRRELRRRDGQPPSDRAVRARSERAGHGRLHTPRMERRRGGRSGAPRGTPLVRPSAAPVDGRRSHARGTRRGLRAALPVLLECVCDSCRPTGLGSRQPRVAASRRVAAPRHQRDRRGHRLVPLTSVRAERRADAGRHEPPRRRGHRPTLRRVEVCRACCWLAVSCWGCDERARLRAPVLAAPDTTIDVPGSDNPEAPS